MRIRIGERGVESYAGTLHAWSGFVTRSSAAPLWARERRPANLYTNEYRRRQVMNRPTNEKETPLSTADVAYAGGRESEPTTDMATPNRGMTEQGSRMTDDNASSMHDTATPASTDSMGEGGKNSPLLEGGVSSSYREKWQTIQVKFVDDPQDSVKAADGLVAEVIQTLARSFADQRQQLEGRWSQGSEVSTEDLRQALRQYRSFFDRLLAA
jgi:hypothetical protein